MLNVLLNNKIYIIKIYTRFSFVDCWNILNWTFWIHLLNYLSIYLSMPFCLPSYLCIHQYCLSVNQSIYDLINQSINLPTYLPTYLSIYLPTYLPIYLPIYLYIYLSIYLSIYVSVYLSACLSFYHLSIFCGVRDIIDNEVTGKHVNHRSGQTLRLGTDQT